MSSKTAYAPPTTGRSTRTPSAAPLFRRAVLENIVSQRLLALHAFDNGLSVSDEQLRETIAGIASFQENGQFSMNRYQASLRGQGMSELGFQERLRGELANQQILSAIGEAAFVPKSAAQRFLAAQLEERTIHTVQLKPEDYSDKVSLSADDAKTYYEANVKDFEVAGSCEGPLCRAQPIAFAGRAESD